MTTKDAINPSHYKDGWSDGAELISITENLNFNRGNAVKYTARAGKKDPATELQDLKKALWYLEREIKRLKARKPAAVKPVLLGEQMYTINVGPNAVDYMQAMAVAKHPRAFA
ncbi:nucleotide kinase [Mycobacterium phage Bromden]|uniref:DUF3310 domain-containing protein n=1 Tax=Mycobacterium phage Bromden TaxID=2283252 RepID=A0A345MBN2_9CAUD|nr:nucleotide kinase [Mycobacterium phage Bromden]AXH67903.1 hypothetical protein SEA_BROMDEN_98 [Mycobacterium phage Bromden]